jgi:hypothetical protein
MRARKDLEFGFCSLKVERRGFGHDDTMTSV